MGVLERRFRKSLQKKIKRGFRGYPLATVIYYGPDDQRASKVAVGIMLGEGERVSDLRRWFLEEGDVRSDPAINQQIVDFIVERGARTVIGVDRIAGCPHEEGIDYPDGEVCPACPFWADRDRWTGEKIH